MPQEPVWILKLVHPKDGYGEDTVTLDYLFPEDVESILKKERAQELKPGMVFLDDEEDDTAAVHSIAMILYEEEQRFFCHLSGLVDIKDGEGRQWLLELLNGLLNRAERVRKELISAS